MAKRDGYAGQPFEMFPGDTLDPAVKESLDRVQQFFDSLLMARFEGDHFEITHSANTTFTFPHLFSFAPKDIWLTSVDNSAVTVTINYSSVTTEDLSFTVAGLPASESVTFRFFAGSFRND